MDAFLRRVIQIRNREMEEAELRRERQEAQAAAPDEQPIIELIKSDSSARIAYPQIEATSCWVCGGPRPRSRCPDCKTLSRRALLEALKRQLT